MKKDIRETSLFREAEALHTALRKPGTGRISDAVEISAHAGRVVFAGTLVESLNGSPPTRICSTDLATGDTRVLTFGPNTDRSPKFSPDGRHVAFLSDRHRAGDFQLYLLDPASGAARPGPLVEGWIEYLHWSPDGKRILLGVAGRGADNSCIHGAIAGKEHAENSPAWMPAVDTGDQIDSWRSVWIYELAADRLRRVSADHTNIWEAAWCGNEAFAAVASPGPGEGLWYSAALFLTEIETGRSRKIHAPVHQIGWPAASPSGKHLVFVEAICSDRWLVLGDLRLMEIPSGEVRQVDTKGASITFAEWRSDQLLLLAGNRGLETVVGYYDVHSQTYTETWHSAEITTGGTAVMVAGIGQAGDCVLVGESFTRAPEIATIRQGTYRPVKSFDLADGEPVSSIEAIEPVNWKAPDGLDIQGWLLLPKGKGPFPLVMNVHGGPVWHWRPTWLGRGPAHVLMLIKKGYALFLPNPRGSSGRGQDFVRHVLGDMGGADTYDYLSGLDHLIERGIADPKRLGVTGESYGGYMTSWLITQVSRFAAAVPASPHTNNVTERLLSNIPQFVDLFLDDTYANPTGKYFHRSPIMHARHVKTPTLHICGALDRGTPAEEALQFHNALLEHGVKSALVTYPQEGHGMRNWPAATDYAARLVGWFLEHMPAR